MRRIALAHHFMPLELELRHHILPFAAEGGKNVHERFEHVRPAYNSNHSPFIQEVEEHDGVGVVALVQPY